MDWNGVLTTLSDPDALQKRANNVVLLAGAVALGLIILWKVWR